MGEDKEAEVVESIETVGFKQSKVIRFNKTWVIEKYDISNNYESPIFSIGRSGKFKWCVQLTSEYNAMYCAQPRLRLLPCNVFEITVKPTYSLLNANGEKAFTLSTQSFQKSVSATEITEYSSDYGDRYFKRSAVYDPANGLLPNGKLTLFCDIELVIPCSQFDFVPEFTVTKVLICDLIDNIGNLLKNKKYSDFTVNVGGEDFPVHKNVLSMRSRVFEAMFEHEMAAKKEDRVNITDIEPEVFDEMLRFIYTGKVPNLDKMADKLLMVAEKYQLERLKIMCEEALYAAITVENVADMLIFADLHNANHLKERTTDFMSGSYLLKILETENFRKLIESRPDLAIEMLRGGIKNEI